MEVLGLPLHVLVVHAVVVFVPLAAVGGIAISLVGWARKRYGELVVLGSAAAAVLTFVAQQAGEAFLRTFKQVSPAMLRHSELGGGLLWWTILLFVSATALVAGQWMIDHGNVRGRVIVIAASVLTVIFAVVSLVQVVRIGHSGAYAVWGSG